MTPIHLNLISTTPTHSGTAAFHHEHQHLDVLATIITIIPFGRQLVCYLVSSVLLLQAGNSLPNAVNLKNIISIEFDC